MVRRTPPIEAEPILAYRPPQNINETAGNPNNHKLEIVPNQNYPKMYKFYCLASIVGFVVLFSEVSAVDVPPIPSVWLNTTYPFTRCFDFCGDLAPGIICPRDPRDITCLCDVYNIRLPAVHFRI